MADVSGNALWVLVSGAMTARGLSYRGVELKSGGSITKSDLGHWKNGTITHLSPEKLIAAAAALDLDLDEVVAAALQVVGLAPQAADLERTIQRTDLPELVKRRLLRVIADHRASQEGARPDRAKQAARGKRKLSED